MIMALLNIVFYYYYYLNWENCRSFENSNESIWLMTFCNSVECLLERNTFCVNLIVLQEHISSFVDHIK